MGSEEINTSEESRSHVKELLAIGLIASADRHRASGC